ncbi:MAG: nitroreductase family protein [Solirubrobacteraceae bacterium]
MKSFQESVEYRRSVRIFKDTPIEDEVVEKCIRNAAISPNSSNMQMTQFIHITSPKILKEVANACLNQLAAKTAKQIVVIVIRKDWARKRAKQNENFIISQKDLAYKEHKNGYKLALLYYNKLMPFLYFPDFLGILGRIKFSIVSIIGLFKPMVRQTTASDLRVVSHKSAGIASQTFMLSMASNGYDTCAMEGLDSVRLKKILNLPCSAEINMAISCGIRDEKGIYGPQFRVPFEDIYSKI